MRSRISQRRKIDAQGNRRSHIQHSQTQRAARDKSDWGALCSLCLLDFADAAGERSDGEHLRRQVIRTLRVLASDVSAPQHSLLAAAVNSRDCSSSSLLSVLCLVSLSCLSMVSSCNDFVSNHGEELETILYKGEKEDRAIREKLCIQTRICQQLWTDEQEEQKVSQSGRCVDGYQPSWHGSHARCLTMCALCLLCHAA